MRIVRALLALVLVVCSAWLSVPVTSVSAQEQSANFDINPLVLNDKGKPRDILKQTVTLTNTTGKKLQLYATVSDFDPTKGAKVMNTDPHADKSRTLANWIEVTRGQIELEPDESIQVPYLIHINLRAAPGTYHAELAFLEGGTRKAAQEKPKSQGSLMITIEVLDDARERLQLDAFMPDQNFFSGGIASFSYAVENVGNRTLTPRGNIRIYNRRGEEVATLPVNGDTESISPTGNNQLAAVWDAQGRFGKYKAFLDLEYGQTGAVQDTVYFWIFPWREVLIGFILLLILAASVTYLIHVRLTYNRYGYAGIGGNAKLATQSVAVEPEGYDDEPSHDFDPSQDSVVMPSRAMQPVSPVEDVPPVTQIAPRGGARKGAVALSANGQAPAIPASAAPERVVATPAPKPMSAPATQVAPRAPQAVAPHQTQLPAKRGNAQPHHVVNLSSKRR